MRSARAAARLERVATGEESNAEGGAGRGAVRGRDLLPPLRFLVLGISCFALLIAAVVILEIGFLEDLAVSLAKRDGRLLADHVAAHYMKPGVFLDAAGAIAIPSPLPERIRAEIAALAIVKLKVFDLQGRILASTDPEGVGTRVVGNDSFQAALAGRVVGHVASRGYYEHVYGQASDQTLLEIYVPIWLPGTNEPAAVLELYRPWSLYQPIVRRGIFRTTAAVGVLSLLFAAALVVIHRHAVDIARRLSGEERR